MKKFPKWGIKFNCAKREQKELVNAENPNCCRCTCYKRKEDAEGAECGTSNAEEFGEARADVAEAIPVEEAKEQVQEAEDSAPEERDDNAHLESLYGREMAQAEQPSVPRFEMHV